MRVRSSIACARLAFLPRALSLVAAPLPISFIAAPWTISLVAVPLTLSLVATPALAQQDPKAAEAKKQFEAGMAAMNSGDLARARELFTESLRLVTKANTVFNLAACEEKLGLFATAARHFDEALTLLPPGDDRAQTFLDRIAAVTPKVPRLTLSLAEGVPPGTSVLLDGSEVAASSLGVATAVDGGSHEVVVKAPGRLERSYRAELGEGQKLTLFVKPGDSAATMGALRTTGFVSIGVGAASLVAGGVTGLFALRDRDALQSLCPDLSRCVVQGEPRAREGMALGNASTALFAVGGALAAAGAVILIVGRPKNVAVQATLGPTGLGLFGQF
ncbi:MAG: hypothetical protein U0441_27625 [Polyangiaceae bacterium]